MAYPMARRAWAGVAVTMHQLSSAVSPYSARPYGTKVVSYSPADAAKSGRKVYDLRSDTVTTQPRGMLEAMLNARVGDDVLGDDSTIRELEERIADLTGKESALFVSTGTAACQIVARSVLPVPPVSVICHEMSHIYNLQSMGLSFLSGAGYVCVRPKNGPANSHLERQDIENVIFTDSDVHVATTGLVCLENPMGTKIMPLKNASEIYELCRSRNVPVNVDGSRLWNASSATGISIAEYSKHSDNITMCFSKGLCCPIGSVIAGSEKTIAKARHYRKVFGGSWRQGGYFAASCLWALDNILPSLNQDNIKAKILADLLHERGIPIKEKPEINMIFLGEIEGVSTADLTRHLCERGVLILIGRVALHQYIPMDDLEDIANVFEEAIDACKREKAQC